MRISLNLYEADYLRLKEMYPYNHTVFLRELLRAHLSKIETDAAEVAEVLGDEIVLE